MAFRTDDDDIVVYLHSNFWECSIDKKFRVSDQKILREMGRLYLIQLDGRMYTCRFCHSHLALCDELVSKSFHCRHGRAYLFNTVVNVSVGPQEERMMTTGMHTVADIFCNCCGQIVGWKYVAAHEKSQKYKEGKFIIERTKMVDFDGTNFYVDVPPVGTEADDV